MKMVYKLIDKSLVLGTMIDEDSYRITIKAPMSVTQSFNPQTGQPEIVMLPMDLIFGEAAEGKDTVTFKKEHIMYEKPMSDFPPYEQNYNMQTTGIEAVQKSGIIS